MYKKKNHLRAFLNSQMHDDIFFQNFEDTMFFFLSFYFMINFMSIISFIINIIIFCILFTQVSLLLLSLYYILWSHCFFWGGVPASNLMSTFFTIQPIQNFAEKSSVWPTSDVWLCGQIFGIGSGLELFSSLL